MSLQQQQQQHQDLSNTLLEAIKALYHHPDKDVQRKANEWLQDFQRRPESWEVSNSLLHDAHSGLETLIFCSQTLKTKVQQDFEELAPAAFTPLRDSLKNLLKKFSKGPSRVRTQICVAMAALAAHVPAHEWGNGGILNWLRDQFGSEPDCIGSFLELLIVLPQEASSYKIAVRPERRRQFQNELASSVDMAFGLLSSCLVVEELKEQVLDAFSSWLRLSHGIPASSLASHPLVVAAMNGLHSDTVLDASVNAVCELIRYTVSGGAGGLAKQMPLVQIIVPNVMSLQKSFKASSEDEETLKSMARLFAEMGDSYVELIASGSAESMMIVGVLVEVTSHPDFDICAMTFNFWHSLQNILTKRKYYSSFENEAAVDAEMERRRAIFTPTFELLVSLVSFRVKYPENFEELSREDIVDLKRMRYAIGDILMDITSVLGGDSTLKILSNNFFKVVNAVENGGPFDWKAAEASLYCIRAIAKSVPTSERSLVPQIVGCLPKLPHQPQLLQTACLTVGALSKWFSGSSNGSTFLPLVIEILTKGLCASEDSSAAAAMALRHICDACKDKLAGSLDNLFFIYHNAVSGEGGYKLSQEDSLQLIEALSMVITALPLDHAKKALEALCFPAVSPLQQVITQASTSSSPLSAKQYTVHIDRLANIFRFVNHPEAVADAFQNIWPVLKMIFKQCPSDMTIMERLCRACKFAVRTCGKSIGITIGDMLEEVQLQYQAHHLPCFLYLSSEVIKIFGSDPSCSNYLANLITSLFSQTLNLLKTIQDFTLRPDIADDCFLLASRCIRYCPPLLIHSPTFSPLVDCAMTGITVQHREAGMSVLTFLTDIFDVPTTIGGKQYQTVIDSVIQPRAADLTRILIGALSGALPESQLEQVVPVIVSMVRVYGMQVVKWAQEAISLIPSAALSEIERSNFLSAISSAASGMNSSDLIGSLEELSDICRRNKGIQDIVQGALQPLNLTLIAGP